MTTLRCRKLRMVTLIERKNQTNLTHLSENLNKCVHDISDYLVIASKAGEYIRYANLFFRILLAIPIWKSYQLFLPLHELFALISSRY